MINITVFHNSELIKTYEFDAPVIHIGRLPENEIPLANISISRRHARIEQDATQQYTVADLNSLNGVLVNNQKIKKVKLSHGDKIAIGKYTFLFETASERGPEDTNAYPRQEMESIDLGPIENADFFKNQENGGDKETIEVTAVPKPEAAAEPRKQPQLIDTGKHLSYTLDRPIITIGSSENDDIFVDGFLISDGHALIEKGDDGTWIHAKTLIGRFKVNGKKVSKYRLEHKDQIEIGKSIFRYMENGQQ